MVLDYKVPKSPLKPEGSDYTIPLRPHPKAIQLQRVESAIKDLDYLRYPLIVAVIYFFVRLVYDASHSGEIEDLVIELLTLIAYGYGLQAFTSKCHTQWIIFFVCLICYFPILGLNLYVSAEKQSWGWFGWHVFGCFFNIFIFILSNRYRKNLRKRDQLQKDLVEFEALDTENTGRSKL